ncbi:MAG TPA: DUF2778 domain-containing protein [Methylovirgula sp.]
MTLTLSSVAALALSGIIGVIAIYGHPDSTSTADATPTPVENAKVVGLRGSEEPGILPPIRQASQERQAAATYGHLLDLTFELGSAPVTFDQSHPLAAAFNEVSPDGTQVADANHLVPAPVPQDSDLVANVPLPAPRPADLASLSSRTHRHLADQQQTTTVAAAPETDNRSILEKFFGDKNASGNQTLAYASAEDGLGNFLNGGQQSADDIRTAQAIASSFGESTAVYNIAAHTVYMPDGTKLEAHSGLGEAMDDPHYVSEKMRGATPPNTYDLQPRETLFHGVQALRLIPVGNGDVYGRAGLLAHSYMLGPLGASNGCVSFRNYNAFLAAYMNGEVKHLVVVAGL